MPKGTSPFASWFNVPDLSDVLLSIHVEADCEEEPRAKRARRVSDATAGTEISSAAARTYHCHGIILSAQSGYFKAQISSKWQQTTSTEDTGSTLSVAVSKRTVQISLKADELDAMQMLLIAMYNQSLPAAASPTGPMFLQCLSLADRFEMIGCMDLLLAKVAGLRKSDINLAFLSYMFEAPPGVRTSDCYPTALEPCTEALVKLFCDVPAVVVDEQLRRQFCSLPHAAVLAWAKSRELKVHSENCVVFLVSDWVKSNPNSTAAQLEALTQQIRVFHLGPSYQHHILPNLPWFKHCRGMAHLPAVLSCIRAGVKMKHGAAAEKCSISKELKCPPRWMSKPRRPSNYLPTYTWILSSSMVTRIDEYDRDQEEDDEDEDDQDEEDEGEEDDEEEDDDVEQKEDNDDVHTDDDQDVHEGDDEQDSVEADEEKESVEADDEEEERDEPPWLSPPFYVNGFMLRLSMTSEDTTPSASAPGKTMGLYVRVDVDAMRRRGLPCPAGATLPFESVAIRVGDSSRSKQLRVPFQIIWVDQARGLSDALGTVAPTFLDLVTPYLKNGELEIMVTFKSVDIVS